MSAEQSTLFRLSVLGAAGSGAWMLYCAGSYAFSAAIEDARTAEVFSNYALHACIATLLFAGVAFCTRPRSE